LDENFPLFSLAFWRQFVPKVFFLKKNSDEAVASIGCPAFAEFFQKELEEAHLTLCKISSSKRGGTLCLVKDMSSFFSIVA
jgi:hypothetical protein